MRTRDHVGGIAEGEERRPDGRPPGQRAAVSQVDGGRWLTLEGPVRLVTDPDGVRAGVDGLRGALPPAEANATTESSSRSPSTASSADA